MRQLLQQANHDSPQYWGAKTYFSVIAMYTIFKTTPFAFFVSIGAEIVRKGGESFARGYGSPDFIVDKQSIENWKNADGSSKAIVPEEQKALVDFVLAELTERGWKIIAE